MADGFDSQFWKDQGYKYNTTAHPECAYEKCDRSVYPTKESSKPVKGYTGVIQLKYGKPPMQPFTINGAAAVRCQSKDQCLEIDMADGFDSQFWKDQGYKYNTTAHPECAYEKCDRSVYPTKESSKPVKGYTGVLQLKYGKPPM